MTQFDGTEVLIKKSVAQLLPRVCMEWFWGYEQPDPSLSPSKIVFNYLSSVRDLK